jgi:formylmethanofuran dehydrogenase subunit E
MKPFEELLQESVTLHGHMCPGQILGVRLAMVGCREVDVDDPRGTRKLIVWVEIDRCATDAIQSVTGCKLGKRTLKYVDYGKMAATFLNTDTGKAIRVLARDDSRERAPGYAPLAASKQEAQLLAYRKMPDEELFVMTPVSLSVREQDMPGHPVSRVVCDVCGEGVNDRREVRRENRTLCRPCADGGYYEETEVVSPAFLVTATPTG